MKAKEIISKVKQTIEVVVAPVIAVVAIWGGVDVTAYVAGAAGLIISALEYAEMFIKE